MTFRCGAAERHAFRPLPRGEGGERRARLWLSRLFLPVLVPSRFPLLPPPSITMDPFCPVSRRKQAVPPPSSLQRERGQNLNIDITQCETKVPVLPVSLFGEHFVAVVCVSQGVRPSPSRRRRLRLDSCVFQLLFGSTRRPGMKYHLLLDSGNRQVSGHGPPADLRGRRRRCLWSGSTQTNGV